MQIELKVSVLTQIFLFEVKDVIYSVLRVFSLKGGQYFFL